MKLWCLSLDYKRASIELRSKALPLDGRKFVEEIAPRWQEKVWIQTCNRIELYGLGDEPGEVVLERWAKSRQLTPKEAACFRSLENESCVHHLFRVCASIESMVIGESQITGQIKSSYQTAIEWGSVGTVFHKIFQRSFKVAKKVRSKTELGRFAVSIPSVGVKLAERVLGALDQHRVLVMGLGEIGQNAAEHFGSVQPKKLFLYNRTPSVAEALETKLRQEDIDAEAVSDWESTLTRSDVVVSALGVQLLTRHHLKQLEEAGRPVFVLDLGVPPSVEDWEGSTVYLFRVDDLQKISNENQKLRAQELERAELMVVEEADRVWHSLGSISLQQALDRLASKIEQLREAELDQLRSRLEQVTEKDWQEIEKMSARLTSKVVQDPMVELKSLIESAEEKESVVEFFRSLFRI